MTSPTDILIVDDRPDKLLVFETVLLFWIVRRRFFRCTAAPLLRRFGGF